MDYHTTSVQGVLRSFRVSAKKGLTDQQVADGLEKFGPNVLEEAKKINPFVLFLNQFRSFIIYILVFAVVLSFVLGEYVDAIVILIILFFNAIFGFIQEYNAERAIDALKKLAGFKVQVVRNGKRIQIDTKDVVPGDIILLEEGNKVPADARLISSFNLRVAEASLTGESVPVNKITEVIARDAVLAERKNMVFSGTNVVSGRGVAIVVGTGMSTQIGKIAGMITKAKNEMTPLQEKLEILGKWIGGATLIICGLVFVTGVIKDDLFGVFAREGLGQFLLAAKHWFLTAVALAVAAVPEGLPAIVTIALAIGVKKMLAKHALIRKLPSVETLGEATVICSDKTGTLTKNEMTVRKAYVNGKVFGITGAGYHAQGVVDGLKKTDELLFTIGISCNNASFSSQGITGDPTEAALLVSAAKAKVKFKSKRIDEVPFDSERKMMSVVVKRNAKLEVHTKGAPEHVLKLCKKIYVKGKVRKITAADRRKILKQNNAFASDALRVLAFAYKPYKKKKELEQDLIFVGLQGMIDPPHSEVAVSVATCKQAGIRVIMITGDNALTAQGIAKEIGITGKAMNGADFAALSRKKQKEAVKKISIFARVEPTHKMQIVELLQDMGEVVAMTGDGVNDAPAIKKADLGIAMGIAGTDVAKESSEMVLQDDNFSSIVKAIEEGRGIFENIKKFVNYLLSSNLGEVMVIFVAILLGFPLPMTAIMLLWLNLVTDGLPALALSVDPNPSDLMKKPPKKKKSGIMTAHMAFNIGYVSVLITIGVLCLFAWSLTAYASDLAKAQSIAFTAIIVMEIVRLQTIRSAYNLGVFSNMWLVFAVISSIGLQLLVLYTPLSTFFGTVPLNWIDWSVIILVSCAVFLLNMLGEKIQRQISAWRSMM